MQQDTPIKTHRRWLWASAILLLLAGAALLARPAISAYYSSRWLDAVLKELDDAKRKTMPTPEQEPLWADGVQEFRQLLESMRGKRDQLREMYERAANDAEAGRDYDWINTDIARHWRDMMDSHGRVVKRWHLLDQALNPQQRQAFRGAMRELVVKDWEHFSGRWNRYLTQQAQLTQVMGERILRNPTPADRELGERIFGRMKAVAENYEARRRQSTQAVDRVMSDPSLPLTDINPLAEANWYAFENALREVYALSREYYQGNSMGQAFRDNKGRLAAAAFRRQKEMTPPSYNN